MEDPVEQTELFKKIADELETKIELRLLQEYKGIPPKNGWSYTYWEMKKEILKNDYNIDWKSPIDLDPDIVYD